MSDTFTLAGQEFTRDELAAAYTASFYLTNNLILPPGHPPTPAQMFQLKMAEVLGEDVPEAALQDVQRAVDSAREQAQTRQAQREQTAQRQRDGETAIAQAQAQADIDQAAQARAIVPPATPGA